jgi:hypothetical protein
MEVIIDLPHILFFLHHKYKTEFYILESLRMRL